MLGLLVARDYSSFKPSLYSVVRGRLVSVASSSSLFARASRGSSTHCGPKPRSRGSSPYMHSPRTVILLKIDCEEVGASDIFTIDLFRCVTARPRRPPPLDRAARSRSIHRYSHRQPCPRHLRRLSPLPFP